MLRLAIFDMDGTILDTLEDLCDSLNHALAAQGLPARSLAQVRRAVGNGIFTLLERSVPAGTSRAELEQLYRCFMPHYGAHCADKTHPYPGINAAIAALRQRGIVCSVLSNKADSAVQTLAAQYFPGCFDLAMGERDGVPRKPAPDSVHATLARLGFSAEEAVYIGDSEVDLATAQNAGVTPLMVTWGFRERAELAALGAEHFVDSPEALVAWVSERI